MTDPKPPVGQQAETKPTEDQIEILKLQIRCANLRDDLESLIDQLVDLGVIRDTRP
jgi:hypothetical protein